MSDVELDGRVALVTGASRGLGRAIAAELARGGAHLVMMAREGGPLGEAVEEVGAARVTARQVIVGETGDVASAADVERIVGGAIARFGRLDVLVCNAGVYGPLGRVEDVPWDEWAEAIAINLYGVVLCCRAAVPQMRRQRSGKLIAVSGGGATSPLPGMSAYAASKAAVVRFVETLALEIRDDGIDVNAIAPGTLNTRLLDEAIEAGPARIGQQFYDRMVREKERGGTPLEVGAALVRFLASSASDGISGRLIAAVWDDWRHLPEIRERLAQSDVFTLRRILPADRGWDPE